MTTAEANWLEDLSAETPDGRARGSALQAFLSTEQSPTSLVSYQSRGEVLVIGPGEQALPFVEELDDGVPATVLVTDGQPAGGKPRGARMVCGKVSQLAGYLGHYAAAISGAGDKQLDVAELAGLPRPHFDLVVDFSEQPLLGFQTPPFGYYPVARGAHWRTRALEELPDMGGEFEKPKFFNYDPDICAHGNSGLSGCTRCLDGCTTGAIQSLGDQVEVDPYLCQGVGVCVSSCPTGAMTYAYPSLRDLLRGVRRMLQQYREQGGEKPVLLFHDREAGSALLKDALPGLPEHVLPVAVEEVGSLGADAWLAPLAYGAAQVCLLGHQETPPRVVKAMREELGHARAILGGMGYPRQAVEWLQPAGPEALLVALRAPLNSPQIRPAGFETFDEKRSTLRLALEHLLAEAPDTPPPAVALREGAPFGQVLVDAEACTLCMACPQVCPTRALLDNPEAPQLRFVEDQCVQCGLCEQACPEDAITLEPRYLYAESERRQPRILNEEEPFCCESCGTPFGTRSVIERMLENLEGHRMFQDEAQRRRLRMCGDCRVKDMFKAEYQAGGEQ